jgi:predicted nucleic acid-binding protein
MIVLDSDVLIDVIDQREPSFAFVAQLQAAGEVIGTTSINAAEVLRGVPPRGRAAERVARVLAALQEVPFGPAASRRFGTLMHAADRAGTSLPVVDALIAAATLESGGRLLTRNARDFATVAGLEVLAPK